MRYKFFFALVFAFSILVPSQTVFAGNSATVTRGDPMPNISWSVGGAPSCTTSTGYPNLADGIRGQWRSFAPSTGSGTFSFSGNVYAPAGPYTFTCTAGAVSDTATLNVNDCSAPATWNGTACEMPATTVNGTCSATPETCSTGTYSNSPADTAANYRWTCLGGGVPVGTNSGTCTSPKVAPPDPVISSFTATPNSHPVGGGNSTLAWSVSNATSCDAAGGDATWDFYSPSHLGGSSVRTVATTTTYQLQCWNSLGVSSGIATVTVTVAAAVPNPVISSFIATPNSHGVGGGNSTLAWSVSNATSCWASNGWTNWKSASGGSEVVFVGSTSDYHLECWNAVGVSSGTVIVTVTVGGAVPNPVIVSFTATPNGHAVGGGNSTLDWSISDATSCWASGGWSGWKTVAGGSQVVSVGSTTTYSLECWNGVGVSSGVAGVTVMVAVPPIPAALHICPPSATIDALGPVQNLRAWYTPAGTNFISCANTTGAFNRTVNTTWTSSNPARASVGVNTGVVSGLAAGVVTITANDLANGVSSTATITVDAACVPDVCGNHASEAANTCTGDTFTIDRGCGLGNTSCPGTRLCDYNWKEVAP